MTRPLGNEQDNPAAQPSGQGDASQAAQAHLPALALVSPGLAWERLSRSSSLYPAFAYQAVILFASWVIGASALREMALFSGFGYKFGVNLFSVLFTLVQSVIAVLAFNALVAIALVLALKLLGIQLRFKKLFFFTLVVMLPFVLGLLIGSVNLFFQRPLSSDVLVVVATYLKPFSLGLVSLFPQNFPHLSLPWFLASYFDFFGIWSVVLSFFGFRYFFGFPWQRSLWATISLVLVLILLVTLLWQAIQTGLSSTLV